MLHSPLAGIRIVDFSRILAGPFCSMLLGDLGAEIWKIERPGIGDDTRSWMPPATSGGASCYFVSINRNKKSVVIDLKHHDGQRIARNLALKADVLIENFIPGTMQKLGSLDYANLSTINPRLVYCSISGYGQTGPYANKGGYDVIVEAIGGLMHITGSSSVDSEPCKAGVAVVDMMTGLYAHGAIMAALMQRNTTGRGQHIDCNLLSTQIATLANIGSNYLNANQEGRRWGTAHESIVPYQAFKISIFGHPTIAILSSAPAAIVHLLNCRNCWKATNGPHLMRIERTPIVFATKSLSEWEKIFEHSSLPNGPVNDLHSTFAHPQVSHLNLIQTMQHRLAGSIKMTNPAVKYTASDNRVRLAPPMLGEHTKEVLVQQLNMTEEEIEKLKNESIIDYI